MFDFLRLQPKTWVCVAAVLLALGVSFGAFGAHALRDRLDEYARGVYEKAVFYHFVHSFGVLVLALAAAAGAFAAESAGTVCLLLSFGVLLFSGSLYALALTGVKGLGAITPFGGALFIAGWLVLAWKAARS